MRAISVLREASYRVYDRVKDMAGTAEAGGDCGRGAGGDISHRIDIAAEDEVLRLLRERQFACTVLGEECGEVRIGGEPEGYVIMDAIDGSANAVRGVPYYCCSLAFAPEHRLSSVSAGVVTDLRAGAQFWATRGGGAFCDDTPISVRSHGEGERIIGINMSGVGPETVDRMRDVLGAHNHMRHFGANALEMAYVAGGLLDALVDIRGKIRVQDMAAGYLLVSEAGGAIVDGTFGALESDLSYEARLSFVAASGRGMLGELESAMRRGGRA